jgi:hypothetical protein
MRAMLALLFLGALVTGCGGGSGASNSVLPPLGSLGPVHNTETPLSASVFNDSIGVNLHMTYAGGAYDSDFATWSPILAASGIKHVRDAICPSLMLSWCVTTESARVEQLALGGIRFDMRTFMSETFSYVASYAVTMDVTQAIESYEGPNECDASPDCPVNWQSIEGPWQQQLYTLKSPGVTIVAPSMTSAAGYDALGNLAAYADYGNIHDYAAAYPPEAGLAAPLHLQWAALMTGSDPVWCTENGYNTDPTYANNGVPQVVQERYLPRMLLEHLRLRVMRTYIYQLFDFGPDGGSNMGLLNADYTPKPAWTRLLQLLHLFADGAPAPRTPLTYSITGDTSGTLDHLLLQRSDGSYLLAVWLAQPVYDIASRTVLPIASETLAVNLPASASDATLTAFEDNGALAKSTLTGSNGSFQIPVRTTVSILEFHV